MYNKKEGRKYNINHNNSPQRLTVKEIEENITDSEIEPWKHLSKQQTTA